MTVVGSHKKENCMMYLNKIVATLKINGKFLRDEKGVYKIPFGSEYKIWLKNMESRDAVVKIEIDGKDALGGNQLVLRANTWSELDGFIEGFSATNKFKFIEFTKDIEEHVGYNPEYSLIKIEARFVKPKPVEITYNYNYVYKTPKVWWNGFDGWNPTGGGTTSRSGSVYNTNVAVAAYASLSDSSTENDLGITVKGDYSNQQFCYASVDELEEESTTIVLKLSGYRENSNKVTNYVTVKEKLTCSSCGLKSNSSFKFCPRCGTFLE